MWVYEELSLSTKPGQDHQGRATEAIDKRAAFHRALQHADHHREVAARPCL